MVMTYVLMTFVIIGIATLFALAWYADKKANKDSK